MVEKVIPIRLDEGKGQVPPIPEQLLVAQRADRRPSVFAEVNLNAAGVGDLNGWEW